ncbi:uncharacterized protein N7479_000012 [Penicillium vulpinum]|uniref:Major facilitator superfamily (MFS) profile domain-containing protein n=1 Tax=Penicillium vulpinum TaxID=29845 RepID=A0A1V6R7V7_9EURO|nr:uncharacterized protein N7479_000012 [Penicillium vulpinum]KAJ5970094.1 hypothetical protein N7479_000012 [Penicillium vulpinum]OQD97282.1 hypothetical protein PENVUL_c084G07816 [Penicillium vulpinum]
MADAEDIAPGTARANQILKSPTSEISAHLENAQILLVAFHSMMGTFMAAGIIPAYNAFAEQYNVTVPDAIYLTSSQILIFGISPLIWNPVIAVYGRYHVALLSVLGSMISSHSLKALDFVAPFSLAKHPRILIIACAHAITFCYGNIAVIVEMPLAFGEKFHFDAQQIGLQFIAIIIGCVLGEQVGGPMSDWFLKRIRESRGKSCLANRLWLSYIAFATIFAGILTWGFQLQRVTTWSVTPCLGAAIASFGNQMQTRNSHNICRGKQTRTGQSGSYAGAFYFPNMFSALSFGGAAGVMVAIIGGCALVPVIAVQFVSTRAEKR